MKTPVVSICCVTYNHEKYITQCIEGFLNQKTNFDFEILIHDDASTDRTTEIIKEFENMYPNKFRNVYQIENQFLKQNTLTEILFKNAKGKYIAICEGDDYWEDTQKLQKQIDFLENNSDYGIVFSRYNILKSEGTFKEGPMNGEKVKFENGKYEVDIHKFLSPFVLHPMTTVFRKELFSYEVFYKNKKTFKDIFLFAMILSQSKGAVLDFVGGVYRLHSQGIWSLQSEIKKSIANYKTAKAMHETYPDVQSLFQFYRNAENQTLKLLCEKNDLTKEEKNVLKRINQDRRRSRFLGKIKILKNRISRRFHTFIKSK